ncbi:HD-GYP domain-containing protein [Pantoea agglomerans]|uniref:HD-GYP domain-containing protein n=1 Tax=Enterobacter agglomerans TaxID=549 RepID=UPI001CD00915|nr:HD domain-containing phosphohydrolase [Pantoea agglomerans]UBN52381.1 HD domain-containing protein [Pantoea agglomerans]
MIFNIGNTLILLHRAHRIVRENTLLNGEYSAYIAYRLSLIMGLDEDFCAKSLVCSLLQNYSSSAKKHICSETKHDRSPERIKLSDCSVFQEISIPARYREYSFQELTKLNITRQELLMSSILKISDLFNNILQETGFLADLAKDRMLAIQHFDFKYFKERLDDEDFYPGLVTELERLTQMDDFWFYLRDDYIEGMIRTMNFNNVLPAMNDEHALSLARLLSTIVDMKSPLTYQHSIKVGELARFIGKKLHLDKKTCNRLHLAGLLHDIGKINTEDAILNKCGKLTPSEYRKIQAHATDTRGILRSIIIDANVVAWAAEHHERLDGSGYPMKKTGEQLTLQSRILAIADVFQALCQKRSYRDKLNLDEVLKIIRSECAQNKLCAKTFAAFEENAEKCYNIAK